MNKLMTNQAEMQAADVLEIGNSFVDVGYADLENLK
jgi:hypothetical protein